MTRNIETLSETYSSEFGNPSIPPLNPINLGEFQMICAFLFAGYFIKSVIVPDRTNVSSCADPDHHGLFGVTLTFEGISICAYRTT